jgi:hypothetical protein
VRTVDVGAWAALVLGPDGGPGSAELCLPLAQRPDAFGLSKGESTPVRLLISLTIPDQDMTRVHARTLIQKDPSWRKGPKTQTGDGAKTQTKDSDGDDHNREHGDSPVEAMSPVAQAAASAAVETLVEALRGLGGEASASEVKVEVRCSITLR